MGFAAGWCTWKLFLLVVPPFRRRGWNFCGIYRIRAKFFPGWGLH